MLKSDRIERRRHGLKVIYTYRQQRWTKQLRTTPSALGRAGVNSLELLLVHSLISVLRDWPETIGYTRAWKRVGSAGQRAQLACCRPATTPKVPAKAGLRIGKALHLLQLKTG